VKTVLSVIFGLACEKFPDGGVNASQLSRGSRFFSTPRSPFTNLCPCSTQSFLPVKDDRNGAPSSAKTFRIGSKRKLDTSSM
jgi:hypothetical protein